MKEAGEYQGKQMGRDSCEQGGGNGGGREKVHQWAQDTELPLQLQVSFH